MKQSLNETHPHLIPMWHKTKNVLQMKDVTSGCKKKVWWQCIKDPSHVWETRVICQTRSPGCRYCNGQFVCETNCLATKFPEVAKSWHPTKNGELTPFLVTGVSAKQVWWNCPLGHEWQSRVFSRTKNGSNCPICFGRKAGELINLAVMYPEIAAEWHPTKNGNITPKDVVVGSANRYWWQCSQGHEWRVHVFHRTKDKNKCPYCTNQKICIDNCLATKYPNLVAEWHPDNELSPYQLGAGARKRIKWQCAKASDHVWIASLSQRTSKKTGCPCCCGRKIVKSNCLATTHPAIAAEWHPTKNGDLTPEKVTYATNKNVWFQCTINNTHVWKARIATRTTLNGCGCPYCASSKGEKAVKKILDDLNITYKIEYKFQDCRHKRPLPFDFAVLANNEVKALIEYQGRHHFENVDYFQGTFEEVTLRDSVKKKYCEDNNIPLLAVPHWNINNIEKVVIEFLEAYNLIV